MARSHGCPGTLIWLNAPSATGGHIRTMKTRRASPELPLCPACIKPMGLARMRPRAGALPERQTFQCKNCSFVFTEVATGEGALPERVRVLLDEACHTLQ